MDLSSNYLGEDAENIKNLGEYLRYLPINLQNFKLDLSSNNLGGNLENMKYFRNCIQLIARRNLTHLTLYLNDNKLLEKMNRM